MSRIQFDRLIANDTYGPLMPPPSRPTIQLNAPTVSRAAKGISISVSVLFHTTVVCILAGCMIAACTTETATPLDARFTLEEADGGGLDVGNADIEIDLPNEMANPVQNLVASVNLPVSVLPESTVAVSSLASLQPTISEVPGGARRGSGASEGKRGTATGLDEGKTAGKGKVTFFGKEVQANTVAFVIDASRSMYGQRFERARTELLSSLSKLEPDQHFFVVFYTDQTFPMFFPDNTIDLIPANERNLGRVFNWIGQSQVQGGTQPQVAMAMTLRLKPDVVFFLSDGDIPFATQGIVLHYNQGSTVHTITFGSDVGAAIMRQIAARNGGQYRFIPDGF